MRGSVNVLWALALAACFVALQSCSSGHSDTSGGVSGGSPDDASGDVGGGNASDDAGDADASTGMAGSGDTAGGASGAPGTWDSSLWDDAVWQ